MRKRKKGLAPGQRKDRKRLQAKRLAKVLEDRRNPRLGLWRNRYRWYKTEAMPKNTGRYKRWRAKNQPFRSYQVAESGEAFNRFLKERFPDEASRQSFARGIAEEGKRLSEKD